MRWNRRVTASVTYTDHPIAISTHREVLPDPRDSLVGYSQSVPTVQPFPGPGGDDFALARYDAAGARTDVLAILHRDWTAADQLAFSSAQAFFSWRDTTLTTLTPAANPSDNWDLLIHVKPTNLASDDDPAVTSRSNDYRIPSSIAVLTGGPWLAASENTGGGDDFNEAEAAYPLTLDPAGGLRFRIDGSVPDVRDRRRPRRAGP